ncbi:hypothetical protein SAMN05660649_01672 [Desulfotomaculum arcticum]|uniref:Uncharacterized protein n=1 Tax=Desulfotruncus arcticus DSM 17038 TaxID=1121424 RepID=A0A1I2RXH2_9FIRM|nr:hypothetical protein [Desulfotruncus arcticus]SFG45385.1 hypothetical protein SAMN05660649_01672 [Desulfotomaculum arcticum] [Desulfotruncus arcticus DSM 17038]
MREIFMADAIKYFESIMGRTWLEENLKLIKSGNGGGVAFGRCIESSIKVPLSAYYWYKAREEIAYGEITGEAKFSSNSLITAATGADLQLLEQEEGFPLMIQDLKSYDRPITAHGQLCIASGYAREKYKVTVKKEYSIAARGEQQTFYTVRQVDDLIDDAVPRCVENSVIYCFIGNWEQDVNKLLLSWSPSRSLLEAASKNNACLVVCGMWIETVNNRPVLVRKGRLLDKYTSKGINSLVYIPNEKIYINATTQ